MSKKRWGYLLLLVLALFQIAFLPNAFAKESQSSEPYKLSFELNRPEASDYETIFGTYGNYWYYFPDWNIYDREKGRLKDFKVDFELHIDDTAKTITKSMVYTEKNYNWNGKIAFKNISVPSNNIRVEYYTKDDGTWFEPYLLHYDLYLTQDSDGMVLRVPQLQLREGYQNPTGNEHILEVEKIRFNELSIYLNGTSGSDTNDGTTPEKAVKTFAKAKELAVANQNIRRIIVTGTTKIQGDITLNGTKAQVVRAQNFYDYLFKVDSGNTASLSDITIDGNYDENKAIEKSLIRVEGKSSTLNISEGAVLKNNYIKAIPNNATRGGAIHAYNQAEINMMGGMIEGNQATYGGGICLSKSVMKFSGGVIQRNKSDRVIDRDYGNQIYSAGGGILAEEGSSINMSDGAQVLNNTAKEIGGGLV